MKTFFVYRHVTETIIDSGWRHTILFSVVFAVFFFYLISAAFFLFLFSRYYIHLLNILINFLPLTL